MRKAIVLVLGALSLIACKENKPAQHATTTTTSGAAQPIPGVVTVEQVRTVLLEKRPGESATIEALDITNDNGIITLRGDVPSQAVRTELVNGVRAMSDVIGVKDELRIAPHARRQQHGVGTTTTTGAPTGGQQTDPGATGAHAGGETGTAAQGGAGQHKLSQTEAVRHSMMNARPNDESLVRGLTILDEGNGRIVLSGIVPDQQTRDRLVDAAKATPGVTGVRDDLHVQKK